jgi:predicted component of type VI protein secretion system
MAARVVISLEGSIVSEVRLEKPVSVVGRHPDCDIVIDHPAISGRHMLFRVVNRTVYAEDLASTNGTRVNGLSTSHHVVHHLDMIEIGRHKLHFFEDSLLDGRLDDLENTVINQYEQTMLAAHVPQAVRTAAARAAGGDELDKTMAITRPGTQLGPMHEKVATQAPKPANGHDRGGAASAIKPLALRGDDGELVKLDRANTMIGRIGRDTALIIKRADGFFIARLSGRALRLNRKELGPGTHPLAERDVIDVGAASFEVVGAS